MWEGYFYIIVKLYVYVTLCTIVNVCSLIPAILIDLWLSVVSIDVMLK